MRHFAFAFVLCLGCIIIVSNLVSAFMWRAFPYARAPVSKVFRRDVSSPPLRAAASTPDSIKGVEVRWDKDDATTRFANELKQAVPEKVVNGFGLEKLVISPSPDWFDADINNTPQAPSNLTLVTRACVRDLYDEVLRQMDVKHIPPPCTSSEDPPIRHSPLRRAVVVGNPGIGKTMGLFHALRRLLRAGKMVTFHYAKRGLVYAFVPSRLDPAVVLSASCEVNFAADGRESEVEASENYTVYKGFVAKETQSMVKIEPFCNHRDAFYLLDPHEEYGFPSLRSKTIVATPPYENKIKVYWKEDYFGQYFMPMYTLDEAARSLQNDTLGYVDEAVVKERFRVVGGNLRAIMKENVFRKTSLAISNKLKKCEDWETVISACSHDGYFGVYQDDKSMHTSTLYCQESKYPFYTTQGGFVSEHVRSKLCAKFYGAIYIQGLVDDSRYTIPDDSLTYSTLKEAWGAACTAALIIGGTFDVRYLPYESGTAPEPVEQLILPPCELRRNSTPLQELWRQLPYKHNAGESGAFLHESMDPCFAFAEAVLYRDVAFNPMPVSGARTLSTVQDIERILSDIVNATVTTPLRLYHCITDEHFEDAVWKGTAPPPEKSTWSSAEGRLLQPRLLHYALCIPRSLSELQKKAARKNRSRARAAATRRSHL